MQIRLISLARTPMRTAEFLLRNAHLSDVRRMQAKDGSRLCRADLEARGIIEPGLSYTEGAIGCALSHLTLWSEVIDSGVAMTVAEDDAVFCANFEAEAQRHLASLPEDWEVVTWGYNADTTLTFDLLPGVTPCSASFHQDGVRAAAGGWPGRDVQARLFPNLRSLGTVCYSVSPRGAARLIGFCLPFRPMETMHPGMDRPLCNDGIDNMMAHLWPQMRAYVSVPPLVLTPNELSASTVQLRAGIPASGNAAAAGRPAVRSFDLFDTLIARRCIHPGAVFAAVEANCALPGFAAARCAAERELHGTEYGLADIHDRLALRGPWTAAQLEAARAAELEAEWDTILPIAETLDRVGPSDLIVSDMYLPHDFVERLVREKAGLAFNTLVLTTGGKASGRVWEVLARDFAILEHHGDNPDTDGRSAEAAGIPAVLARPADPTPIEAVLVMAGLPALGRAVRAGRLCTYDRDPALRLIQRAQIEVNLPLLALSAAHLAREMTVRGTTRALVSGRDGHKLQQVLDRLLAASGAAGRSCVYFHSSRVARTTASPAYCRYASGLMRGERSMVVDLCGTGWSLSRLLDRMELPATRADIYLVHHIDDSPLVQTYRAFGETLPRPILSALRGDRLPSNRLELLNLTDHAMVRDVREVLGRPVPIFLDEGHDAATRPLVAWQDAAFAAGLAQVDAAALQELADAPVPTLLALMEALYLNLAALPDPLFAPLLRQQGREEDIVLAALREAAARGSLDEALPFTD